MLDLDAIQARIDGSIWPNPRGDATALVAELRAAREVRDEVDRLYEDDRIHLDEDERLLRLLAAWDHASDQLAGEAL